MVYIERSQHNFKLGVINLRKLGILCLVFLFLFPLIVKAEEKGNDPIPGAESGILIEATTGQILYEKESHEKKAMASLTKMVAQILILEQIESGKLKWTDEVTASANASGMGGSQIYLSTGEVMTVKDMMKGISMASANDATVAMAEHIAGTEANFVKMMNDKVKELGLKDTNFKNCTGLDEDGHYSTAYDLAMVAKELLTHQQIFDYSSVYEDYLRTDTPNKFWLVNTNKLVRFYDGADGLKTGHTDNAKYCIAATAKQNGMRLIAIVLGEEVSKVRNSETMALLDYGYNNYKVTPLKKQNESVGKIKFEKGTKDTVDVVPLVDAVRVSKKNEEEKRYTTNVKLNEIKLPVKTGDVVGKLEILDGRSVVGEVELTVKEPVEKSSFLELLYRTISDITGGHLSI